jgi:hypothetical protein
MDDIELKLLAGMPIEIDGVGEIHSPLVKDVIRIGEDKYNQYLSYLLIDKDKIDIEEEMRSKLSTFAVIVTLCMQDQQFQQIFLSALQFIFNKEAHLGHDDSDVFFYFGDIRENNRITKEDIEIIQAIIRVANHVKIKEENEDEYRPAGEEARKMIEEMLERRRNKPKPKPTINLHSIISGLAWKSNNINIFDISKLSIYQLYDGFHRQESIDSYNYTLVGIYSGNVDGKKVDYNNIHWTKILKKE